MRLFPLGSKNVNPFHLMVFFTFGVSIETWVRTGLIGRELKIYKQMIKEGHRVSFITYGDEKDLNFKKLTGAINIIPIYRIVRKPRKRFFQLLQSLILIIPLCQYIRKADFLKTNQMYGGWLPVMGKFFCRKPLVVRCGYEFLSNMIRAESKVVISTLKFILGYVLEAMSFITASQIILSNHSDREYVAKWFPYVRKDKIQIIRNYIDTAAFNGSINQAVRKSNRLLFIGRVSKQKNLLSLINAIENLPYGLDIIGDGTERTFFEEYVNNNNADVRFLGAFPNNDLPRLINQYKVYILPSIYENNPKSLLETMACARLVIGANVPGIKELIQHGKNGFLCEPNTISIQKAIENAMQLSNEKIDRVTQLARKFVIQECSLQKIYDAEIRIYHTLSNS